VAYFRRASVSRRVVYYAVELRLSSANSNETTRKWACLITILGGMDLRPDQQSHNLVDNPGGIALAGGIIAED
jgi:hypothetical protein